MCSSDLTNISNLQPGQSYADRGMSYDSQGNNVVATPEQIKNAGRGITQSSTSSQNENDAFFERAGRAAGIKEEGKEDIRTKKYLFIEK